MYVIFGKVIFLINIGKGVLGNNNGFTYFIKE